MQDDTLTIATEQHGHSVTVYVAGVLSIASALRLVRVCENLPSVVRVARLDLSAVHRADDEAVTVLESQLRHWRARRAELRVTFPPASARRTPPARSSSK